ncbi:hypothetical protein Tco_1165936 [Tanacetum coccineum]
MTESPLMDSSFAIPVFSLRDDPIACLNKAMDFLTAVASSRFPSTYNQLRTSSNLRNQATIQDGKVTVQQVQGRQGQSYSGTGFKSNATSSRGNNLSRQARVAKRYNCQVLAEAQEAGQILDEEQLAFLADLGVPDGQAAVLMANISNYGYVVISEVPSYGSNVLSEQLSHQVTNFNKVNKDNLIANESLSAELERYKERKAQQIRPMLYDGSVIAKETNVISIADSEETLMLEEESRSKMLLKQSDPMVLEKKVNIQPINYAELNRLSKDFDKQCFEIQKKQFLIENDRLLDQIISQDIVNIVVNSSLDKNTSVNVNSFVAMNDSVNYVEMCNKCLKLEAELIKQHNMVEKDEYNRLSKSFSKLEQHCISLELAMQLNKENFQKNNTSVNQTEPSFDQLFELNNLKAELQAKDTTIQKLKAHIKRVNETSTSESVKKDFDEIETINIELEHRVTVGPTSID